MKDCCKIQGCRNPVRTLGMCNSHHLTYVRHGNPNAASFRKGDNNRKIKFLKSISVTTENQCIPFPFKRNSKGYGTVSQNGKSTSAQNFICRFVYGPPPKSNGYEAAHSCGNGHLGCVNPNHLRWATRSENHMDRILHGTSNRGERNGHSKLTTDDVFDILWLKNAFSMKTVDIARSFDVSVRAVRNVLNGTRWSWLVGDLIERTNK